MKEKAFERQQQLLDAALEEFSQWSFDQASINRILKNSGISKGVFYYHFNDKEALYLCLMEDTSQVKWEFITAELQHIDIASADIFEMFRLQASAGIRFAQHHPRHAQFARMLVKEKNPGIRAHIDAAFVQSEKLEVMVERAMHNGNFSTAYSKDFLVAVIGFMFAHFNDIFPCEQDAHQNLDRYIAMMKNGLGQNK